VLNAVLATHETVVRPSLTSTFEQSAAATISHLLRHVALRIEVEGQILTDDIADARKLLVEVRSYLEALDDAGAARQRTRITEGLERQFRAAGVYPALASLAEEAGSLRQTITTALEYLQSIRPAHGDDAAYRHIRDKIRGYIVEQLRRESELIEPAFADKGPRR